MAEGHSSFTHQLLNACSQDLRSSSPHSILQTLLTPLLAWPPHLLVSYNLRRAATLRVQPLQGAVQRQRCRRACRQYARGERGSAGVCAGAPRTGTQITSVHRGTSRLLRQRQCTTARRTQRTRRQQLQVALMRDQTVAGMQTGQGLPGELGSQALKVVCHACYPIWATSAQAETCESVLQ